MGSGFDFSPDQIPQSGKGRRYSQVSAPLPPARHKQICHRASCL